VKVYLGADHRGFELKNKLKEWLFKNNYEVEDCGPTEYVKDDDFIDYAVAVSKNTVDTANSRGVLICGSGAGVEITANKIKGVRCSLGQSDGQIAKARNADDINILALAGDFTGFDLAKNLVKTFLETGYDPAERHVRRINKISELEKLT